MGGTHRTHTRTNPKEEKRIRDTFSSPRRPNISASPHIAKCSTASEVQSLITPFDNAKEDDDGSSAMEDHEKIRCVYCVGSVRPNLHTTKGNKVLSVLMQQQ